VTSPVLLDHGRPTTKVGGPDDILIYYV
jgi:hypothetical protein